MAPTLVAPSNLVPTCDHCGHPFTDRFPNVGASDANVHRHCALYYKQPFVDKRGIIARDHGR